MTDCVTMHNMIVEDERPKRIYDQGFWFQADNVVPEHGEAATLAQFSQFHHQMRDWETRIQLLNDLVGHMRAHIGSQLTYRFKNVSETIEFLFVL